MPSPQTDRLAALREADPAEAGRYEVQNSVDLLDEERAVESREAIAVLRIDPLWKRRAVREAATRA